VPPWSAYSGRERARQTATAYSGRERARQTATFVTSLQTLPDAPLPLAAAMLLAMAPDGYVPAAAQVTMLEAYAGLAGAAAAETFTAVPADHARACPRMGLLARCAKIVERAWVRVAREAVGPDGHVIPEQSLVHTTAPGVAEGSTWLSTAPPRKETRCAATPPSSFHSRGQNKHS